MNVIRETQQGPVKGKIESKHYLWAGIPFAAPVTQETRFKLATDPPVRSEVLDCTKFRSTAVQTVPKPNGPAPESDDCLFLNIYAPLDSETDTRKAAFLKEEKPQLLPVLFWIHGGGYLGGSGAGYCGDKFCEEQLLVIVTINYRLTLCGFTNWNSILRDPLKRFDDHVGISDQAKALEWVYHNIANFGGDPSRITLGGESAGGSSVAMLMTDPKVHPFYQQVIIQSGSLHILDSMEKSRAKALHVAKHVLSHQLPSMSPQDQALIQKAIDSEDYTNPRIADILISLPTRAMHDGVARGAAERDGQLPYGAWLDGNKYPSTREEAVQKMPTDRKVLVGHNKDESMMWSLLIQVPGEPEELPISEKTLAPLLERLPEDRRNAIKKCYPLPTTEGWIQLSSDIVFINATRHLAKNLTERGAELYRYRLDKFADQGEWSKCVPHAVELLAFWDMPWSRTFIDADQYIGSNCQKLSKHMRDCWGAFMHTGNPGWLRYNLKSQPIALFNCLNPSWSEVASALTLPEESPEKVAAWDGYELYL